MNESIMNLKRTANTTQRTSNIELKTMVSRAWKRLLTVFQKRETNKVNCFQGAGNLSATSMFNVGCSMFDVQKICIFSACVALAGALLLSSGCMVGPDYRAPQYPAPRGWSETAATQPVWPGATRAGALMLAAATGATTVTVTWRLISRRRCWPVTVRV